MPSVLDKLHQDHVNLARCLDFLDGELAKLGGNTEPDFELMQDVMRYVTSYPDVYHHPWEDRIFARLRTHPKVDSSEIDSVLGEHEQLAMHGQRFLDALVALEADAILRTDTFVSLATNYTQLQRVHLDHEEGRLFKLADQLLSDADWAAIEAADERPTDPLFGAELKAEFARIAAELDG